MYDMAKDQLERMRQAIMDPMSGAEFVEAAATLEDRGIPITGDALKTAPRGYPKDHPRIAHLRLKQVLMMRTLPRSEAVQERRALEHALQVWSDCKPMISWLGAHVGPSEIPPEARYGGRSR